MSPAEFKAQVEAMVGAGELSAFRAARNALYADLSASGFDEAESADIINAACATVLQERAAAVKPAVPAKATKLSELRAAGLLK